MLFINFAEMKLSIIIPVYNVEKTLERCVESVLKQKFRDYQVILVNDGSFDNSAKICDELTKKDRRVQVIHKQNGGLSDARNAGIKKAKGEYITFIDSDDFLASDTLKPLMDLLAIHHDYDILEYSVYEHYGRPKHMQVLRFDNREYSDVRAYWYEQKAYRHTYAWNKIYRRELFDKVKFPVGRKFEDVYTLPKLLNRCHVIATTSEGFYYYCYNDRGITAQADGNDLNDLLNAHLTVLNKHKRLMPVSYDYYVHVLNIALDVYESTGQIPQIPPAKAVCSPFNGERCPMKIRLLKLIGMKCLCKANKLIHRFCKKSR